MWRQLISSFSLSEIISESTVPVGGWLTSCPGRCEMQPRHLQPAAEQSELPGLTRTRGCSAGESRDAGEQQSFPGLGDSDVDETLALVPGAGGELGMGCPVCPGLSFPWKFPRSSSLEPGWAVPPKLFFLSPCAGPPGPGRAGSGGGMETPPGGEAASREEAPSPRAGLQGEEAG